MIRSCTFGIRVYLARTATGNLPTVVRRVRFGDPWMVRFTKAAGPGQRICPAAFSMLFWWGKPTRFGSPRHCPPYAEDGGRGLPLHIRPRIGPWSLIGAPALAMRRGLVSSPSAVGHNPLDERQEESSSCRRRGRELN